MSRLGTVRRTLIGVLMIAAAGCARRVALDQVPIGTTVEVTRLDGGVVRGTLAARDDRKVRLVAGRAAREISRAEITSVQLVDGTAAPVLASAAKFREFTIPEGTVLAGRLESAIGSDTSERNDPVEVTLTDAVILDGLEVLPAGSIVSGVVTSAQPSRNVSGRASLAVRFTSVSVAGSHETYIVSAGLSRTARSTKADDVRKIALPAVMLATSGPDVHLLRGAAIAIPLDDSVDVRVPIKR